MAQTRDEAAAGQLGALVKSLMNVCRFCRCEGGHCKQADGDPCELIGELQNRCNGVACVHAHAAEQLKYKRETKRGRVVRLVRRRA